MCNSSSVQVLVAKDRIFHSINMLRLSTRAPLARSVLPKPAKFTLRPLLTAQEPEQTSKPTEAASKRLSPEEAKAEAAKAHVQTIKDMGSLFSSGSEDATQPIDTAPVFKNPQLFGTLSLLHQGQVLQELQEKYDKKWHKLTDVDKKLGYYIAYGDWGVREKFANWRSMEPPLDLPFTVPSKIRTTQPKSTDIVKKLEPVILAETPIRQEQFNIKKMDPVTKTFIYITIFVAIVAVARDKKIGEEGKPKEIVIEEPQPKKEPEPEPEPPKPSKKWYYLWLK